ncbi:MAG: DUF2784 domain-containing protein [Calditrichaeota bacterium]|nr:DUF2784 domain-containing protein [Calditrichota bacterium]
MPLIVDRFLNGFFFVFHSALIVFNLLGWAWRRTRRWNLYTLLLTGFSWFGLGIWYGFGYCPSTDWHWQVRRRLGYYDMPTSYIQFLLEQLTGWTFNPVLVDVLTLLGFLTALCMSIYLNYRDRHAFLDV